ncbi:hypothetical protein SAMN05421676_107176 [Salinibacillus kushneri]|uniref:DUF3139 domain-containing protein n=2 Tax=Salinibacillus kushneri TaxID=237682 RepID=A0A1I0GUW7_9BACI|nr:hypothetical protein SAMN05421676_107176 [Salinibacillus kushneri]
MVGLLIYGFQLFTLDKEKSKLKNDTISYLENKGYDEETDIKEIYIVAIVELSKDNELIHTGDYQAVVHFEDEPKNAYFYTYKNNTKEIIQIDSVNEGTNQSLNHKE